MAGFRKVSAGALVLAMTALALLAWWSMLAAERAAVTATEQAARQTAVATAVAIASDPDTATQMVTVTEAVAGIRILVLDSAGTRVAGTGSVDADAVTVPTPGRPYTVAVEIDDDAGLGLGRYSRYISAAAFLVMAVAVVMLRIVARDRRRTQRELDRLGQRWDTVAAADELTGLGNRTRLVQDADALISRGTRYGNSFGLAIFELDGEPSEGLILAVAETLRAESRGGDLCYRIRNGQFVSLLPEQDEVGAAVAAERVRRVLVERLGQPVRTGAAAFSPWLPCSGADLLTRAELDLGELGTLDGRSRPAPTSAPASADHPA